MNPLTATYAHDAQTAGRRSQWSQTIRAEIAVNRAARRQVARVGSVDAPPPALPAWPCEVCGAPARQTAGTDWACDAGHAHACRFLPVDDGTLPPAYRRCACGAVER